MLFNKSDPFPNVSPDDYSYLAAKDHAEVADQFLGLQTELVEAKILKSIPGPTQEAKQNWQGLAVGSLMTPYVEIRLILNLLAQRSLISANSCIVDLGCAYARMAHVILTHFEQVHFVGFEIENLRVEAAWSALLRRGVGKEQKQIQVLTQDLAQLDFVPPKADIYFIYDFGSPKDLKKTLADLQLLAKSQKIVVVGRGRAIRHEILTNQPWLGQVVDPEHFRYFSLFYSA